MQLFAVIGIALAILYLAWVRPRYFGDPIAKKTLIVLSILLAVLGASEARWQYFQWRGSVVVKEASGNPKGQLDCQRFLPSLVDLDSSSLGGKVTSDDPNVAHLKNAQCNELFSWIQSGSTGDMTGPQIIAVHVLTHESIHVSGEFSEAIAECTAIQRDPMTVETLGGSEHTGKALQKIYFDQVLPKLSKSYQLDGCKIDPKFDTIANPPKAAK